MTSQDMRTVGLPVDHLIAEVTAYPLASEAAFRNAIVDIGFAEPGKVHPLWRAAERDFIAAGPNISIDEVVMLRDRVWFSDAYDNCQCELHNYLRRCASQNLAGGGVKAKPNIAEAGIDASSAESHEARSRMAWRWLSFALPPDLLLAAMWTQSTRPSSVELANIGLSRYLLEHGYAETHLHVGAAVSFQTLWLATLYRLADNGLSRSTFEAPGAAFNEGREFSDWLVRAASVRYLLASFLYERSIAPQRCQSWDDFITTVARPRLVNSLSLIQLAILDIAMTELAKGELSGAITLSDARAAYAALTELPTRPFPNNFNDLAAIDPINSFFRADPRSGASSEIQFVAAAFEYFDDLAKQRRTDPAFCVLFWQATRMRAIYYRHIVQRPMTPGLQWFIRFFGRIRGGRQPIGLRVLLQSACAMGGLGRGLRSLEIRTAPDASMSALRNYLSSTSNLLDSERTTRSEDAFEAGVVFHLPKHRGGQFKPGTPYSNWANANADPAADVNPKGYRFSSFFEDKRRETEAIANLVLQFPQSLKLLRGFDICTDELAVPSWVLAPCFRYLRDVAEFGCTWMQCFANEDIPFPRKTIHTGEDFVHVLGGLRSVFDVIHYLGLNDGDRIGHGVVLGVDAAEWAKRAGRIAMSIEMRMLDLTFEWRCYNRENVNFRPTRLAWIDDQIRKFGQEIFGYPTSPADVVQLVDDLHCESLLRDCGFPVGVPPNSDSRIQRVLQYLTDPGVFKRGHKTIWVQTLQEHEAVENIQEWLRGKVANLGLTIEINPTSNLLIGNLGDLRNHPLWRLRPPIENRKLKTKLRVCVGSDDPITFATNLPDEYVLLHDSLVLAGLGADRADDWIDHARKTGMRQRFTIKDWKIDSWIPAMIAPGRIDVAPILYG
jgi:hypothetical protein